MIIFIDIPILIILINQFWIHTCNAVFHKCPPHQLYFQKIVGYRPMIQSSHPIPMVSETITVGNDTISAINIQCWTICSNDIECNGYVLFYRLSQCYGFTKFDRSPKYEFISDNQSFDLIKDFNGIYFEKICINDVPVICKNKLWPITKIPGTGLLLQGKKTITNLVERTKCAELCLHETEFKCLSAYFIASHRNNFIRENKNIFKDDVYGTCILSTKDKSIQPDAFRVASRDEEYIENQCYSRTSTDDNNCSYEIYGNSVLAYADTEHLGLTQKQCQTKCAEEQRFFCQGVSYFNSQTGILDTRCLLHSEDIISMGPRALLYAENFIYMRRVQCLNVTVTCTDNDMIINYTPYDWFYGKIYVNSHSEHCSSHGQGVRSTVLRLPIGSEIKENRCGILRAYQIDRSSNLNRTLISSLIVIQTNPIVQTQGDRLVKVGCILHSGSGEVGTNRRPNEFALASTISINQDSPPNEGTIMINTTGPHSFNVSYPHVIMRIVDTAEHLQTNEVDLGQNLQLQIELDPPNSSYDIRGVRLLARSNAGHMILLIDEYGCPTDITVFPALDRAKTDRQNMLFGNFHAFKFAGSTTVTFNVTIQFCPNVCSAVRCDNDIISYGRRKRQADNFTESTYEEIIDPRIYRMSGEMNTVDTFPGDYEPNDKRPVYHQRVFADINLQAMRMGRSDLPSTAKIDEMDRKEFTGNQRILTNRVVEVPLELQLNVREPNVVESESLIYGENSHILVSGIDIPKPDNSVCFNQTLLLLLMLLWMLVQIILLAGCCILVRKYRRKAMEAEEERSSLQRSFQRGSDFDTLGRKVRWADDRQRSDVLFLS